MSTNKYFTNYTCVGQQKLVEDLSIEAIKNYGYDVRYLPRTVIAKDNLYGEDALSQFSVAAEVEMYIKNVDGFGGEGDFLSKFGLEIRDQMTLTVARKRWSQIATEKLLTEVGYNYLLESANTSATGVQDMLMLEDGNGNNYSITSTRPLEGDLIYFPLNSKMYEIKFVEHESVFYQMGSLQTYDLTVELFEYSSERIDTGNTVIDAIETEYSLDTGFNQLLLETGDGLLDELTGGFILIEHQVEDVDRQANNAYFETNASAIIDFSEVNPYGDTTY